MDACNAFLTRTRQLDVMQRRLGRIGDMGTQCTDTSLASLLRLASTAPVTSTPTFRVGTQTRRIDAGGRFKPSFDIGTLSGLLGWSAGSLNVAGI